MEDDSKVAAREGADRAAAGDTRSLLGNLLSPSLALGACSVWRVTRRGCSRRYDTEQQAVDCAEGYDAWPAGAPAGASREYRDGWHDRDRFEARRTDERIDAAADRLGVTA